MEEHLCQCGCGRETRANRDTNIFNNYIVGHYIKAHHPFQGKMLSEKHRENISDSHKGTKMSEEQKKNWYEANKGKHNHSEEWKANMSLLMTGRKMSPESIKKRVASRLAGGKKGKPAWNKGKPWSSEVKLKFRNAKLGTVGNRKGKINSEEHRMKISVSNKGKVAWNRGKKGVFSEETRKHWSDVRKGMLSGEKHPSWLGGKSFEPYGLEFNNGLKEKIRERDQHRCQECFRHQSELRDKNNMPYKLMVHHIDYNKTNNSPENLISLCRNCHTQTNFDRNDWSEYFKERGA